MLSYRMRNAPEMIAKTPLKNDGGEKGKEEEENEEKGWNGEWTLEVPEGIFVYLFIYLFINFIFCFFCFCFCFFSYFKK